MLEKQRMLEPLLRRGRKLLHGLGKLALLLGMIGIASCETRTIVMGSSPVCGVLRVITFSSSADSKETVRQIRENNAALREICEGL